MPVYRLPFPIHFHPLFFGKCSSSLHPALLAGPDTTLLPPAACLQDGIEGVLLPPTAIHPQYSTHCHYNCAGVYRYVQTKRVAFGTGFHADMTRGLKSMKESSSGASPSDSLTHRGTPPSTVSSASYLGPYTPQTQIHVPLLPAQPQTQLTLPTPSSQPWTMAQASTAYSRALADPHGHAPSVRDTAQEKYFCWNPKHHVKVRECFMKLASKRYRDQMFAARGAKENEGRGDQGPGKYTVCSRS
ncbi:hypothetical protein M9H77_02193 [Catharanthus roseus]|uniref:Uncharacterized protein n=1 Tax=Catharanthus roseus TaxID=4058 RepID=A0ACC0C883_CATRO|nr:hypothetical protein M9H77_02193 [Catharanthus roseus]